MPLTGRSALLAAAEPSSMFFTQYRRTSGSRPGPLSAWNSGPISDNARSAKAFRFELSSNTAIPLASSCCMPTPGKRISSSLDPTVVAAGSDSDRDLWANVCFAARRGRC